MYCQIKCFFINKLAIFFEKLAEIAVKSAYMYYLINMNKLARENDHVRLISLKKFLTIKNYDHDLWHGLNVLSNEMFFFLTINKLAIFFLKN
jgi:hypothetical protein